MTIKTFAVRLVAFLVLSTAPCFADTIELPADHSIALTVTSSVEFDAGINRYRYEYTLSGIEEDYHVFWFFLRLPAEPEYLPLDIELPLWWHMLPSHCCRSDDDAAGSWSFGTANFPQGGPGELFPGETLTFRFTTGYAPVDGGATAVYMALNCCDNIYGEMTIPIQVPNYDGSLIEGPSATVLNVPPQCVGFEILPRGQTQDGFNCKVPDGDPSMLSILAMGIGLLAGAVKFL